MGIQGSSDWRTVISRFPSFIWGLTQLCPIEGGVQQTLGQLRGLRWWVQPLFPWCSLKWVGPWGQPIPPEDRAQDLVGQ